MRSINHLLLFFVIAASVYSCTPQLGHPLVNSDITYMAKPVVSDSTHWGTYVSAYLNISDGYNYEDMNTFWELDAHQSYTFNSGNVALGAFGYRGAYRFDPTNPPAFLGVHSNFLRYSYYGGGLRGSFNFTLPTEKIDVRFIGFDAVWTKEWGDYLSLRKRAQHTPETFITTEDELLSTALTSEICIKLNPRSQLAVKLNLGHIHMGQIDGNWDFNNNFYAINVHYAYRPLIASAQINLFTNPGRKNWLRVPAALICLDQRFLTFCYLKVFTLKIIKFKINQHSVTN